MAVTAAYMALVMAILLLTSGFIQGNTCPSQCSCHTGHIICKGVNLVRIPSDLPKDIEILDLSNNFIHSITEDVLKGLSHLRVLNLSNNRIMDKNIASETFMDLLSLEILDLSENRIEHFVHANLTNLINLRVLNISRNDILDLECSMLSELQNLTQLHVTDNKITVFPDECFRHLNRLEFLDLSYNKLHIICEKTFAGLPSLKTLLLNNNRLHHSIAHGAFQTLNHLQTLNISQSNVYGITNKTFRGLADLQVLNLSYNAIDDICLGAFNPLISLTELHLTGNPIIIIPDKEFKFNIHLEFLYINRMPHLLFLYPNSLYGLSRLKYLNASLNPQMRVIHYDVLQPLAAIQVIDFSYSGIETVHESVFRNVTSLKWLIITGNPITCSCAVIWLKNLMLRDNSKLQIAASEDIVCDSPMTLKGMKLRDIQNDNLTCAGAEIKNYTVVAKYKIGESAELKCIVYGEPAPSVTWITPTGQRFHYVRYEPYKYLPTEIIPADHVNNASYHAAHLWHKSDTYETSFTDTQRIHLLDNGNLYIDYVMRGDAGPYVCKAKNSGGNDTKVIKLQLNYFVIREVREVTFLVGAGSAAGFLTLSIIFALLRALASLCTRSSSCCKEPKERKGIREILGDLDAYKTERIQTLRDNYHAHVDRIKEQCSQNLLRLRENYHSQMNKIRENCTQKIENVRENYSQQKGKIKNYGSDKVVKIRENYKSQMLKIREYSHGQLKKLHDNYKLQQQHILKILELLNIENCKGVIDAECLRTDSMLFDAQLLVDNIADPDAMTPDTRSESDYMTAGSNSEVSSIDNEQIEIRCHRAGSVPTSPLHKPSPLVNDTTLPEPLGRNRYPSKETEDNNGEQLQVVLTEGTGDCNRTQSKVTDTETTL